MLLNGARGLSEPQASCPECRFAFKHFFSPLEVPGFWNGARNIPLHSQNTILQILRSIPDTLPKPLSELNSCTLLYLPVNRFNSILFQELIRLAERPAAKESPVRGQRAWMRRRQNQVLWIVEH